MHEYIVDLNASAAARRAGFSVKTAGRQAIALLTKPHILARIAQLQAERNNRVQVDADWVLRRLVEELEADAADLFEADGRLKPVREWPEIWRKGMVSAVRVTHLYERDGSGRNVEVGELKDVQFADRTKKTELLGKHISVQAFREKVHLGADNPLQELFNQIKGQAIRPAIEGQAQRTEPEPQRPALPFSPKGSAS